MERVHDTHVGKFVTRRMTSVKTALRLLRHELEIGGSDCRTVTLDRQVVEDALGALEMFVDDFQVATGGSTQTTSVRETNGAKAAVPSVAPRIK
jgi:hypothetical protein